MEKTLDQTNKISLGVLRFLRREGQMKAATFMELRRSHDRFYFFKSRMASSARRSSRMTCLTICFDPNAAAARRA